MILQGKNKLSWAKAVSEIYAKHGLASFQNAFTATAIREALFVAGYLELPPLLKNKFEEVEASPGITTVGSSVTSGLLATAASHPFDIVF